MVGAGGKVVKKILLRAPPSTRLSSASHPCPHCQRAFPQPHLLHQHLEAFHKTPPAAAPEEEPLDVGDIDVITAEASPAKPPITVPATDANRNLNDELASSSNINWDELANKKVTSSPLGFRSSRAELRQSGAGQLSDRPEEDSHREADGW